MNTSQQKDIWPGIILGSVGCILLVLCALILLGVGYKYVSPYFGSKITIIFEPDVPQGSKVSSSDLETAAGILNERSRLLGVSSASFTVSEDGQIVGQVPGNADIEKLLANIKAVGLLEFVDFGNEPIPAGTKINTDFGYKYLPQSEGKKWHTVMTNNEISSVSVTKDSLGKPAITFTLTPDGTKLFADYTTDNIGKYLGIVLDKVVLSVPRVNSPINDGSGIIQGSFTQEEAENLVSYLKIKDPLPFPLIIKQISSGNN